MDRQPLVSAGPDLVLNYGETISLQGSAPENLHIIWTPSKYLNNPNSVNPLVVNGNINEDISNLYTGEYSVILTDYNNCEASLQLMVGYNTFDNCFFIPTLFTPNGDNIHDFWEIDGTDLFDDISVKVFNRWGQLVFESTGYTQAWDGKSNGKELPTATYYYSIDLNDGREPYNGPISIKR